MRFRHFCNKLFLLDIAYRATRPLAAGEEVLLDYGPAWQAAWQDYAAQHAQWRFAGTAAGQDEGLVAGEEPSFRHYLSLPVGMYSHEWLSVETSFDRAEL